MSEVLSGSGSESPRSRGTPPGGFGFFPADERQSLRVGRFLMAAGTSLLVCVALAVCAFLDLLPWRVAIEGTAGILVIVAGFYALFRTGLNLRFADPSLTTEQVAAAILFLTYIMYYAESPAREALTLFYPVAMLFGVLRLTAGRLMVLAMLALVAHGVMQHLSYLRDPWMDVEAAISEFAILMIVLPWFAAMGGYVNRMRLRLSDSNRELKVAFDRIEQLAIRDELTGAYNRRFLMEALARERSRADRLGTPFSVCVLDLDRFKSVNDSLGHAAGDEVLKQVALVASRGLRAVDAFGRFGGEEFLLVLPDTDLRGARAVAERIRAAVEKEVGPAKVTLTAGVAERAKGENVMALLGRADRCLYAGKAAGRNQVVAIG